MDKAYAMPNDKVNKKYPAAISAFVAVADPFKFGERLMRVLVVGDGSDEDSHTQLLISPSAHTIPRVRFLPSFDPGWLAKFRKNAGP